MALMMASTTGILGNKILRDCVLPCFPRRRMPVL
jgi:hypothetical protein